MLKLVLLSPQTYKLNTDHSVDQVEAVTLMPLRVGGKAVLVGQITYALMITIVPSQPFV